MPHHKGHKKRDDPNGVHSILRKRAAHSAAVLHHCKGDTCTEPQCSVLDHDPDGVIPDATIDTPRDLWTPRQTAEVTMVSDGNGTVHGMQKTLTGFGRASLVTQTSNALSIPIGHYELTPPVPTARIVQLFNERVLAKPEFERMRSKVTMNEDGLHCFEELPHFTAEKNVTHATLDRSLSPEKGLQKLLSEMATSAFDENLPLWSARIVESGYKPGVGVMVVRFHHCVGDGYSWFKMFSSLVQDANDTVGGSTDGAADHVNDDDRTIKLKVSLNPIRWVVQFLKFVSFMLFMIVSTAIVSAHLVTVMLHTEPPKLKQPQSGRKSLVWRDMKIENMRKAQKAAGKRATVNDVLLAMVGGGIRKYLQRQGDDVSGMSIEAGIPVLIHDPRQPFTGMNNNVGVVMVGLPLGVSSAKKLLSIVHRKMTFLKLSSEGLISSYLGPLSKHLPDWVTKRICYTNAAHSTVAISNMRGSDVPVFMAGSQVISSVGFVPPPPGVNIGVALVSYTDAAVVGLSVDTGTMDDATQLMDDIEKTLSELCVSK